MAPSTPVPPIPPVPPVPPTCLRQPQPASPLPLPPHALGHPQPAPSPSPTASSAPRPSLPSSLLSRKWERGLPLTLGLPAPAAALSLPRRPARCPSPHPDPPHDTATTAAPHGQPKSTAFPLATMASLAPLVPTAPEVPTSLTARRPGPSLWARKHWAVHLRSDPQVQVPRRALRACGLWSSNPPGGVAFL